jgi:hypothetical protein
MDTVKKDPPEMVLELIELSSTFPSLSGIKKIVSL